MDKNLIECATCGYPLTKDERFGLVEMDGKMRKPWVGLTDEDIKPLCDEWKIMFGSWAHDFARAIESKLKEKNHEPRKQYKDLCGND